MTRAMTAAFLLLIMSSGLAAQERIGNPGDGLAYAQVHCASCHEVGEGGAPMLERPAASFREIANTPGMSAMAMSVWFRSPHREMPHIQLNGVQMADLIAYIISLRNKDQ